MGKNQSKLVESYRPQFVKLLCDNALLHTRHDELQKLITKSANKNVNIRKSIGLIYIYTFIRLHHPKIDQFLRCTGTHIDLIFANETLRIRFANSLPSPDPRMGILYRAALCIIADHISPGFSTKIAAMVKDEASNYVPLMVTLAHDDRVQVLNMTTQKLRSYSYDKFTDLWSIYLTQFTIELLEVFSKYN